MSSSIRFYFTDHKMSNRPFDVQNHYLNAETADVFFMCCNERIPAHKLLLAGCSEGFSKMFYGPLYEASEVLIVDVSPNGFRQFLRYFYFNELQLTLESIAEVMYLAKKYLLDSCFADCCKFLSEQEEVEGILIGYELSILFGLTELLELMKKSIKSRECVIFESEYFANIDRQLLKQIIQMPVLRIQKAKSIFDGCVFWAQAACKRVNINAEVMHNIRDKLGDCFQHIEFSAMSLSEVTKCVENYGDLFTSQELKGIVSMTSAKGAVLGNDKYVIHKAQYIVSKQAEPKIEVSRGTHEEFQFIPKKRMLLTAFSVSECSEFGDGDGEKGCVASVVKGNTDPKILLHTQFFPFERKLAFREDIVVEPHVTYSIRIQFLSNVSFFAREMITFPNSPFEILAETTSKFIGSMYFKLRKIN